MADPLIIRPTVFPRLDDLSSPVLREDNDEIQYKRHDFSFATNHIPCPRGRNALLKDYSRFIASYTGECEVSFQHSLRTKLLDVVEPQTIQARAIDTGAFPDHEEIDDHTFRIIHPEEGDTTTFDFGLEIIADVDNFMSREASPLLHCVSEFVPCFILAIVLTPTAFSCSISRHGNEVDFAI